MKARCLWFTGLPCSGKTTIVKDLEEFYSNSVVLDGDVIRNTYISKGVGFTKEEREKHLLRVASIAKLLVDNGHTVLCSFVSPYEETRNKIKEEIFGKGEFELIYVNAKVETCIKRDVKGMYKKALNGEINNFTGISAPYEEPNNPDLMLNTDKESLEESCSKVLFRFNPYGKDRDIEQEKVSVFIGRWAGGVLHLGHEALFNVELNKGNKILLLIRDCEIDDKNPVPAKKVKKMLDYRYSDNPLVETMIIPNVRSINWGRGVGYETNEIVLSEQIQGISGTQVREMIANKNNEWKQFVHPRTAEFIEMQLGE